MSFVKRFILKVALDTPLDACFDYVWTEPAADEGEDAGRECAVPLPGQLVLVPFGQREVVGLVVAVADRSDVPEERLKPAFALRAQLAPLPADWLALCRFAADYYQRPLGEVALPGLPKKLRAATTVSLDRALKKLRKMPAPPPCPPADGPALNAAQQQAVDAVVSAHGFAPFLLQGVTGSGKTEVYLQATARVLEAAGPAGRRAQVLMLVPEINLTPQLEAGVRARFPGTEVATLHSGLAEGERLAHWLSAHEGRARIVLGTRLAVLASLPDLALIVVDEEHDASYKQQEGLRYSARDLAIWRARQLGIPIVLGSATPSLESWHHAQSGRYRRLALRERAVKDAVLPRIALLDMQRTRRDEAPDGLSRALLGAMERRLERGEQSLLYLNRRGYAPVIACDACGWISHCARCSAFLVLHKPDRRLRCHHCGWEEPIPRACPTCGNVDLQPLGRGTQRMEESLQRLFPAARILRIDADSTRRKGSAQAAFDAVHRGEVDILIGTQMVAKGHDFRNLTLVGVINPDTALFSHDYRASERLFAQLMQVAGRAGRRARTEEGGASEVLIQTAYPQHPLYAALQSHDYDRFAAELLEERRQAGMPPFVFQALLRAEARAMDDALAFLKQVAGGDVPPGIVMNDPVPMTMARVANMERAQLLVECVSRPALQAFLKTWMAALRSMKTRVRWSLEVDPADI